MTFLATSASAHTGPLPRWWSGPAYGLLGLPLAFVALPLYVVLPHHYATTLGLPLASVGALLMLVRLLDAAAEPLLGRWSDHLYLGPLRGVLWVAGGSALVQLLGLAGLFFPAVQGPQALAAWMVAGLLLTCLAHSQLVIAHQAWGVRLGGDAVQRGHVVAWREGPGLIGVVTASALSVAWGAQPMLWVFALALWVGWLALWWAPRPTTVQPQEVPAALPWSAIWQPLRQSAFRRLLAVFVCNGIASAIPAALMLFFAQDRLQATQEQIALFLVLYFVSGALSMPGWLRVVRRWGCAAAVAVGGYSPGTLDAQGLQRLAWAYAVLPCALKLLAAALLYRLLIRPISLLPDPGVAP